jgi:hypothetical protein
LRSTLLEYARKFFSEFVHVITELHNCNNALNLIVNFIADEYITVSEIAAAARRLGIVLP